MGHLYILLQTQLFLRCETFSHDTFPHHLRLSQYLNIKQQIRIRRNPKSPSLTSHRTTPISHSTRYVKPSTLSFLHLQNALDQPSISCTPGWNSNGSSRSAPCS